jgi:hypothetical protein
MTFKDGINQDEVISVLHALCEMPSDILEEILPVAGLWLRSLTGTNVEGLRDAILITWDRLLATLPHWAEVHDRGAFSDQVLLDESVNHPAGDLAAILITLQDRSPKEGAGGLAPDLRPRFEQLTELEGRIQKLALAPLVRVLPFFLWLAPGWAEDRLCQELDGDRSKGRQLMSTLILYGQHQYYTVEIFNRLKHLIRAALLDPETAYDVRDRIAQFITWAIGLKSGR